MKEEWLMPGAIVPVNPDTTKALVDEIKRLIDVVGGMALQQAEKQEPVAWLCERDGQGYSFAYTAEQLHQLGYGNISVPPFRKVAPLYTTPQPQREWVGLTDEEMRELEKQFEAERVRTSDEEYLVIYPAAYWQWQRAIEAKLKEKNT
jgi:hypothetical protein